MSDIRYNTASSMLNNVLADYNIMTGGEGATRTLAAGRSAFTGGSTGSVPDGVSGLLDKLGDLLKQIADTIDSGETPSGGSTSESSVIAGKGRIWGDPHFIGADGGKYDVQGEAGKTYNLLSDENFQMNGEFHAWSSPGATVVGEVGISAGEDQVKIDKHGTVMVNGNELADGERVALADGGFVEKNGKNVTVESGEWTVDFQVHTGSHLDMDVSTENAIADGVKPHGLLGQTFDGDGKARNGDTGKNTQGGGAIEGANGITQRGDKTSVQMYEVDGLYDRNFESFNQFFDDVESGQYSSELDAMLGDAFAAIAQSMMAFRQVMQNDALKLS